MTAFEHETFLFLSIPTKYFHLSLGLQSVRSGYELQRREAEAAMVDSVADVSHPS